MIKWTFYFDKDHIATEAEDDSAEKLIEDLRSNVKYLMAPSKGMELIINMELVKLITRERIEKSTENNEAKQEAVQPHIQEA